jgi:hypothetical protein
MSDEPEDISRALGFVQAVEIEEWKVVYRKGWRERNEPWTRPPSPPSPPLSAALIAHFAYLDRLKADIKALDTAQSEQRIRRAHFLLIKGGRRDAR